MCPRLNSRDGYYGIIESIERYLHTRGASHYILEEGEILDDGISPGYLLRKMIRIDNQYGDSLDF